MARTILVEDDIDLRLSLVDALTQTGHEVTGVGSAIELYQMLAGESFEIAVLDVNLPHYDGLSIASYLSEKTDMAIVMITGRGASEDRVRGYQAGADLYLVKPVDCEELSAALHNLSRKRGARRPEAAVPVGWRVDRQMFRLVAPSGRGTALSRREIQLVELFVTAAGALVSRPDMLHALGYDRNEPDSRALDAAISRLRGKVQADCDLPLPLQTIQGAGFVFSGPLRAG